MTYAVQQNSKAQPAKRTVGWALIDLSTVEKID